MIRIEPLAIAKILERCVPSFAGAAVLFLLGSFSYGCAPRLLPQRPPENYKGPIAEGPILQPEDYWIYQRPDGTRMKLGAGTLLSDVQFPLWMGRIWRFESGALLRGQPQTSKAHRTPVQIECEATAFKPITVAAGNFEAFECKCQCTLVGRGGGIYEPDCGQWLSGMLRKRKISSR